MIAILNEQLTLIGRNSQIERVYFRLWRVYAYMMISDIESTHTTTN